MKKRIFGLLGKEDKKLLEQLTDDMTKEQLLWTSGYLAGKGETGDKPKLKDNTKLPYIQVLYGTHSGNSEVLSEKLMKQARENGLDMGISIMEKFDFDQIKLLKNLLIIVSTHGEGEPPANAMGFLDYLQDENTAGLGNLYYAVLGLGDTTYTNFSQAGVEFHRALKQKKAKPIMPLRKCDAEFMPDAQKWMDQIINHFTGNSIKKAGVQPATGSLMGAVSVTGFVAPAFMRVYDRNNPYYAKVLKKKLLSGEGSAKEVFHFELSIKDSGFTYQAGDTLSIVGDNPPSLVDAIVQKYGFDPEKEVVIDKQLYSFYNALRNYVEITVVNPMILDKYNAYAKSKELNELINDPAKLSNYLYGSDILDLLTDFQVKLTEQELISVLRKLPPRKYSMSSSLEACPDEAHITVAAVRYEKSHRMREGAVSSFVADRVQEGDKIPVFIQKNKKFKLPEDNSAKLIMIGPGTGIAPFRGFIQKRRYDGIKNGSWLFFGDQHQRTDFLYEEEWRQLLSEGYLEKLDVAFSRDQEDKRYVQHCLLEKSSEVWEWLLNGAFIYVCGDKKRMATDVHLALLDIVRKEGKMDINKAKAFLNQLSTEKRYQKDVY